MSETLHLSNFKPLSIQTPCFFASQASLLERNRKLGCQVQYWWAILFRGAALTQVQQLWSGRNVGPGTPDLPIFQEKPEILVFMWSLPVSTCWQVIQLWIIKTHLPTQIKLPVHNLWPGRPLSHHLTFMWLTHTQLSVLSSGDSSSELPAPPACPLPPVSSAYLTSKAYLPTMYLSPLVTIHPLRAEIVP